MLWERRVWVSIGIILGLLCGVMFLIGATPRYVAQAQLLINPNDLRVIENSVTSSSGPSDANLAEVESQVRVLVSEKVLRQVVNSEGLDRDPEFDRPPSLIQSTTAALYKALGFTPTHSTDPALEALRSLASKVDARREDRTYVVDLWVTTADPAKSVRLSNAMVASYLDAQAQARTASAQRATGELSSRLVELQQRVRDAEDRVEAYKSQNDISGAGPSSITEQQLSEVNNQLIAARARTDAAKSRYDQIEALLNSQADHGAMSEAVQSPTIAGLRLKYADLVGRQAQLSSQLGAKHPSVVDIDAQVRQMRRLIAAEVGRLAQAARGEYARAVADQEALVRTFAAQKNSSFAMNQSLVRLRELERDVEASRVVYEAFLVRSRETSQQERMNTANVRVISEATLPEKTWPPRAVVVLALAGLLGAIVGVALAMAPLATARQPYLPRRYKVEAKA